MSWHFSIACPEHTQEQTKVAVETLLFLSALGNICRDSSREIKVGLESTGCWKNGGKEELPNFHQLATTTTPLTYPNLLIRCLLVTE